MTPSRTAAILTLAGVAAASAALAVLPADAAPATTPTFHRINVGASIAGASFTTVGEVFAGEKNIVTSGYGSLDKDGRPVGGGSLQVFRIGADLSEWTRVNVFTPTTVPAVVFPNATSIEDVDGDGDNDIIVPSGYFFGTDPAFPITNTGAITWWENKGPTTAFTRHVVVSGQPGSYHGVHLADLDGDGTKDLVSTSEEAKAAGDQTDDVITTQFFKGEGGGEFADPVDLADVGGSQPVVADVDGDDDQDIVSSRYFDPLRGSDGSGTSYPAPSFLWLENTRTGTEAPLTATHFTVRTIAKIEDVGMGFQIRPIVGFREPGKVSWIGTNHVNRCTFSILQPSFAWPEQVIEFTPGADITQPWNRTTLSAPATAPATCPSDYGSKRDNYPEFSTAITSRYGPGQGAPGVFGPGDIDGDGDVDLAVSGDGDRRLWWVENRGDGTTKLHQLTAPGDYFGQAGGAAVADFDNDGDNEMVFSSFDRNTLAVWTRDEAPVTPPVAKITVPSSLRVGPETRTVRAGKATTWSIRFTGAPGGARRTVSVVFDPARGKNISLGTVRLSTTAADGVQKGALSWRPTARLKGKGRIVVTYAGVTVSATLKDTRTTDVATVVIR